MIDWSDWRLDPATTARVFVLLGLAFGVLGGWGVGEGWFRWRRRRWHNAIQPSQDLFIAYDKADREFLISTWRRDVPLRFRTTVLPSGLTVPQPEAPDMVWEAGFTGEQPKTDGFPVLCLCLRQVRCKDC